MTQLQAVPAFDPKMLEQGLARLTTEAREAGGLVITDADTYSAVGSVLRERLREYDQAKALRDSVTKPMYTNWKRVCELFKPALDAHESLCRALKRALGDYDLRQAAEKAEAARQARELVQAPGAPDVAALTEALSLANAPQARAEGVSTQLVWKVKRVAEDMLPDAYWSPDPAKIQAEAERQGVKGPEPPVIPGVVFELEASVTGKR